MTWPPARPSDTVHHTSACWPWQPKAEDDSIKITNSTSSYLELEHDRERDRQRPGVPRTTVLLQADQGFFVNVLGIVKNTFLFCT